jgi:hypothetical protein
MDPDAAAPRRPPVRVPDFDTDLAGDRPLSDLDDQEREELCEQVETFVDEQFSFDVLEPAICNLLGVVSALEASGLLGGGAGDELPSDAELQEICAEAEGLCLDGLDEAASQEVAGQIGDVECGQVPDGCTATVGDFEQCLNDLGELREDLDRALPACDALTFATAALSLFSLGQPELPAACETVQSCN